MNSIIQISNYRYVHKSIQEPEKQIIFGFIGIP